MSRFAPPAAPRAIAAPAPANDGSVISGEVALDIAGETMRVKVTVPVGATSPGDLLPIFHSLTSAIVERAEHREALEGRTISCRAGCGACCRQAVPVSPSEARALAQLVDEMPQPRQGEVRARFAAAVTALAVAEVECSTPALAKLDGDGIRHFVLSYMAAGVACPFLDAESCSIHPQRPNVCREYVVTTPAAACSTPSPESVRRVPLPGYVSRAFLAIDRDLDGHASVLLVDSLDWAAAHPAPAPSVAGPALVQSIFAKLADA